MENLQTIDTIRRLYEGRLREMHLDWMDSIANGVGLFISLWRISASIGEHQRGVHSAESARTVQMPCPLRVSVSKGATVSEFIA